MARKGDQSTSMKIAAYMRALGIERTTGRCALCYKIISIEGPKSRYTHKCW